MKLLTLFAFSILLAPCENSFSQTTTMPSEDKSTTEIQKEAAPTTGADEESDAKPQQATSAMAGEASVKPGVGKNFVDPNLDVDSFVKRFEIESREVFLTREQILSACEIEKGDTVADIGAGTGLFSRMFSVQVGDELQPLRNDSSVVAKRSCEH